MFLGYFLGVRPVRFDLFGLLLSVSDRLGSSAVHLAVRCRSHTALLPSLCAESPPQANGGWIEGQRSALRSATNA